MRVWWRLLRIGTACRTCLAASIILMIGDRLGMAEITLPAGRSKPSIWHWQERFMRFGVGGLLRHKTRPFRMPALPQAVIGQVKKWTRADPPGEVTHWIAATMAKKVRTRSDARIWSISDWTAPALFPTQPLFWNVARMMAMARGCSVTRLQSPIGNSPIERNPKQPNQKQRPPSRTRGCQVRSKPQSQARG